MGKAKEKDTRTLAWIRHRGGKQQQRYTAENASKIPRNDAAKKKKKKNVRRDAGASWHCRKFVNDIVIYDAAKTSHVAGGHVWLDVHAENRPPCSTRIDIPLRSAGTGQWCSVSSSISLSFSFSSCIVPRYIYKKSVRVQNALEFHCSHVSEGHEQRSNARKKREKKMPELLHALFERGQRTV